MPSITTIPLKSADPVPAWTKPLAANVLEANTDEAELTVTVPRCTAPTAPAKVMVPVPAPAVRVRSWLPLSVLLNRMLPAPAAPVVIVRVPAPPKVVADAKVTFASPVAVTSPARVVIPVTLTSAPAKLAKMLPLMATFVELIVTPPAADAVRRPLLVKVPVPTTV